MKDFSVEVRIRNNQLRQRRIELGLTQGELAIEIGIPLGVYCPLETMRDSPLLTYGKWRPAALAIARFHGVPIEELFPDAARQPGLTRREFQVSALEIEALLAATAPQSLPSDAVEGVERYKVIADVLSTLRPKEEKILRMRFGLDSGEVMTLDAVGEEFEVTRERIRSIEAKALRKLRDPSRSNLLRPLVETKWTQTEERCLQEAREKEAK